MLNSCVADSTNRQETGAFVACGAILAAGNTDTITEWEAQVNFGMLQPIWHTDSRDKIARSLEDLPRECDPDSNGPTEFIQVVPKWIIRQVRSLRAVLAHD